MTWSSRFGVIGIGAASFALSILLFAGSAVATPDRFTSNCVSCHANDTPTCNGCHNHRATLGAIPNKASYHPGETVTVSLTGGDEHGWVRGLLYDHNNAEVARRSGPTGEGDDGQPNPVVFPVQLQATAPASPGDYVWQAAWFGNNNGAGHLENRVPVTIHVVGTSGVEDDPPNRTIRNTWGRIRALFRIR